MSFWPELELVSNQCYLIDDYAFAYFEEDVLTRSRSLGAQGY